MTNRRTAFVSRATRFLYTSAMLIDYYLVSERFEEHIRERRSRCWSRLSFVKSESRDKRVVHGIIVSKLTPEDCNKRNCSIVGRR